MYIEIGAPATLPLALVKLQEEGKVKHCLLAATLAHPPIHLRAQVADNFTITGPRADTAAAYAQHLYDLTKPSILLEIEIEHAIPLAMGLGSETMLGLAATHAIKHYNAPAETDVVTLAAQLGTDAEEGGTDGLALWASQDGGLLLIDLENPTAPPVRRAEPETSDKNAWGIVFMLPRLQQTNEGSVAENAADDDAIDTWDSDAFEVLEGERFGRLLDAAKQMDTTSGQLFHETIWPAVDADDLDSFCAGLSQLQSMTQAAMTQIGLPPLLTRDHKNILEQMAQSGGLACSQSLTGYALYAFTRGAQTTINVRVALRENLVGHADGQMNATFIDSKGLQCTEKSGGMKSLPNSLDRL